MPSEQSGPSQKKNSNGSSAQSQANGSGGSSQSPNKQIRDFRPPQPQRDRKPTRDDVDKVAGLLNGEPLPKQDGDRLPDRQRGSTEDVPPGRDRGSSDGRSDDDDARTRREPDSSREDDADRPFLQLDEDEDGKPLKRTPKPKSLLEFADEQSIPHKAVYDLVVPIDEGEAPMSIGQMKDRIREVRNFEFERDDFADYRETAMNEIVESRTQIDGVLQQLKQVVPPEDLARAFADQIERYNGQIARAKEQIREYFPEWDDSDKKSADRKKLKSALASYGFSAAEVDNVVDARLIRFAMHAIRLMDRYQRAKESMRERQPSITGPSRQKSPVPNRQQQAKQLADGGDKVGAVAKLLG
jgi:hypothetical protein